MQMTGEEEEPPSEDEQEELPAQPEPQRAKQPRSLRQPEEDRPVVVEAREATAPASRPQPGAQKLIVCYCWRCRFSVTTLFGGASRAKALSCLGACCLHSSLRHCCAAAACCLHACLRPRHSQSAARC